MSAPLADRRRPKTFDDYVGQAHLAGETGALRRAVKGGRLPSIILYGPPGVGKTTLAHILAAAVGANFHALSAISAGVKEVREVIETAKRQGNSLLFLDEIHRFSKAQQDALLGAVEKGILTLIGATTENPAFEVNAALLSRCQVYVLKPLDDEVLLNLASSALKEDEILAPKQQKLNETQALLMLSDGDARRMYNLLELVSDSLSDGAEITDEAVRTVAQSRAVRYDKAGDQHYQIVSAFIKSMRGSDPNGAIYWLARMVEGGEKPEFIARRMLILASEDIGNANPTALVLAQACFQSVHVLGYPEARIPLAQTATYLASSPKSNAAYKAINEAMALVQKTGDLPVPLHLRNQVTRLDKEMGHGKGYDYSHDHPGHFAPQEYLPDDLNGKKFYDPADNPREAELRKYLKTCWENKYGY